MNVAKFRANLAAFAVSLCISLLFLLPGSSARAQALVTATFSVTTSSPEGIFINVPLVFTPGTIDGSHSIGLEQKVPPRSANGDIVLTIGGFSSNPGAGWLSSITCGSVTLTGSNVNLVNFSGSTLTYSWISAVPLIMEPETCYVTYSV